MQRRENVQPNLQTTFENLLNHVVLPRVLPEGYHKDHEDQEMTLLSIMVQTVEKNSEWIPSATVRLCQRLKRAHMSRTPETVSTEISKLQPGETFAMFVRRQNTGLMIHMPNEQVPNVEKTVNVVTFPGNVHPKEIYNHTSDLELTYPSQSLKVKFSKMLRSEEFAFQLCYLYAMLPNDQKHNRNYVNTWLITVLSDTDTCLAKFPIITKKIRDEVIGDGKKQQSAIGSDYNIYVSDYFRRSNFYMSIKVFLQLSLTVELGEEIGRYIYKIIMLQFMIQLCETFGECYRYTDLNVDLVAQFLAKIARRIEKLIDLKSETNDKIEEFSKYSIDEAKRVISTFRVRLDKKIQDLQINFENEARLEPIVKLDFVGDVHQQVSKLRDYLETLKNADNQNLSNSTLQIKKYDRLKINEQSTSISFQYNDEIECHLMLTDFENWVLYELEYKLEPKPCDYYLKIYKVYSSAAERFHANDPFGISKMMLVRLKLVALMDEIAVKFHPLFKIHRSCIDPKVFDVLLLPQSADMKLAIKLRKYFDQRNQTAKFPGLLEEYNVSSNSFSVRFAMKNDEMKDVRQAILDMGEQKIKEKRQEWENGRERVQRLRNEMSGLECEYYEYVSYKSHMRYTEKRHSGGCRRCSLKQQINQVQIHQYECPLPQDLTEQYAISFELRISNEIATLRDMLHLTIAFTKDSGIKIKVNRWTLNHQVSSYNTSTEPIIYLGSSRSINLCTFHVDDPFEKFIALNGENCHYNISDSSQFIDVAALKKLCTLTVEPESPYSNLQWTLNTTTHTQNQVLALQSQCPQNLTLAEYIEFGSLRADGHRLQLRKLYAMIKTEALSFEQSSVLSLILQSMWETGIVGENGFESHDDFKNTKFVFAMIDSLDNFIENQRNNWAHPKKLLLTAFIAVRLFEINGDEGVAEKLKNLLNKLRAVLIEWVEKIQNSLNEMTNRTQSAEQSLRLLLAIVSISCAVTFFVNSKHEYFDKLFERNEWNGFTAPRTWLLSIVTIKNNIVLNEYIQTQSQSYLRMFLRLVRYTAIHIESKIRKMIESDSTDICEFIIQQWPLAGKGVFKQNYFAEIGPQVWVTEIELKQATRYVTIDIITGSFLVNNLPIARLPDRLTANKLYERVFDNYSFEVQTDGGNSFSTVHKYNGCSYEFGWSNNALKVVEHGDYNSEMELIPPEILQEDIPELLVENYSHWWLRKDNIIMFRPKKFKHENFSNDAGVEYKLDLIGNRLIQMRTQRNMLDVSSVSYKRILDQLSRLEQQKYIHVLMDSPNVATIELVRMNLKFKIDDSNPNNNGSYDVLSNEFSRMKICLQQNFGTLYGLNRGLLLESIQKKDAQSSSKLLLLPHSMIMSSCTDSHAIVNINLECELRHPPFYRYEIDEILRQLKPSNSSYSAWFYLAYLHAITAHGESEPLTGMSGTERALQILQSSFVWSSAPYDPEAIKTLQLIANLSPNRELKENIQKITWPGSVPKHCAQDSFVFIVKKLIEDSQRLIKLHSEEDEVKLNKLSDLSLNIRDYFRCLQLKPNHQVTETFIEDKEISTELMNIPSIAYSENTRTVSALYHQQKWMIPEDLNLASFLKSTDKLDGCIHMQSVPSIFTHNFTAKDFRNVWLSLYRMACDQQLNREQFSLLLSLYTHKGENFQAILALQAVASNPHEFANINPPNVNTFLVTQGTYSSAKVISILEISHSKPSAYFSTGWSDEDRRSHDEDVKNEIEQLTAYVTSKWPCDQVSLHTQQYSRFTSFEIGNASSQIDQKLVIWNNNRKLNNFIAEVESKLGQMISTDSMSLENLNENHLNASSNKSKFNINFETKMCEKLNDFPETLNEAKGVWLMGQVSMRTVDEWWKEFYKIVHSENNQHLIESGLFPRMVPTLVLPLIASEHTNQELKAIVGALALAHKQRAHRIETYKCQPQLKAESDQEEENLPHVNWKPCEYPEWLLFEIEQNLSIRRIQIEMAKQMINPPNIGTKHSVMQLNMGEGKTAVIVPILASVLANGKQACQITVLKTLFATNINSLRQYLGGMLNRRIYTFPCRRDMPIAQYVPQMMSIYEECKRERGVILTLPEYRLSFQMKIYESIQKGDIDSARHFLNVHKWINTNVRNILDESDAILHAKYQLIYTVGKQLPLDGGSNRWSVVQAVLKRVPYHMMNLQAELGEEKIEFDRNYVKNGHVHGAPKVDYRPDVFTPCRLLDESVYDRIKNLLIEDFIAGDLPIVFPEMTNATKIDLRHLLSSRQISNDVFDRVMKDFSQTQKEIFFILSGLLRFEVLKLVLMRRWRVNYGVHEKGKRLMAIPSKAKDGVHEKRTRLMAIPFKAKDVAAEMTEFGHPDVAICLTQLSYYYSGLTDQQLQKVFDVLKTNQSAAEIYEKWIDSIPTELIEPSIQSYFGVNLNDPNQRKDLLFPLIRFNMNVIDYWLSIDVFPREAKTFEKKLMCTAWDLCSDHFENRVTGFSGTNDTKNLLPLPIAQNDLAELEQTNENVRQTLLRPENQEYRKLEANISGQMILEYLVAAHIPVLLDAGALMLELSNEEMAREWLKMAPPSTFDAAIYFNSKDVIQTIDRNGIIAAFDCSVYRDNLSRCLVYLDDVHTRGTDLKFPPGWKACVTLSGDIARDKTVQACMRMRQLGKGHSIAFWASHEANIRIKETCNLSANDSITNEHVINFICSNSERFETENTVHWAAAAHNYTKKLAGHKLNEGSMDDNSMKSLYNKCVDDEFTKLENMYGDMDEALITEIANAKFNKLVDVHKENDDISAFIDDIKNSVEDKLRNQAPEVRRFKHALDEEQEKELEHELEEQRQVERPPSMNPAKPEFDELLRKLFSDHSSRQLIGQLKSNGGLITFSSSLSNTQLYQSFTKQENPWSENLFVTRDFVRVLETTSQSCDEFLRPVWWIGGIAMDGKSIWILLSSFECDRLIPTFRSSKKSTLLMYRPRISKLHNSLIHEPRLRVTEMTHPLKMDLKPEVEIGAYAGSMYFKTEAEQNKFCSFLGLIPRPRTSELEVEFENGIIKPNGFVPFKDRQHSETIIQCVGDCRFVDNPVDFIIRMLIARHQYMRKESHVASIVERGVKLEIVETQNELNGQFANMNIG